MKYKFGISLFELCCKWYNVMHDLYKCDFTVKSQFIIFIPSITLLRTDVTDLKNLNEQSRNDSGGKTP